MDEVTKAAFIHGLELGTFSMNFHKDYLTILNKLWLRTDKYIHGEDSNQMKIETQPPPPPRKGGGRTLRTRMPRIPRLDKAEMHQCVR